LLYAGEGEARRPGDESMQSVLEVPAQPGTANVKGHELVQISYHMPTNCEVCPKPLWHMFRPPPALECRRCRIKLHKVGRNYIMLALYVSSVKFFITPSIFCGQRVQYSSTKVERFKIVNPRLLYCPVAIWYFKVLVVGLSNNSKSFCLRKSFFDYE